jgi:ribonuclease P protein component
MNESITPKERIRKKRDFLFIYKNGNRYRDRNFTVVSLSNDLKYSRLAVVVRKKVGNAVKRNKIKRRIKALFRRNKDLLKDSKDLIFIVKPNIVKASWESLRKDYIKAIEHMNQNQII